MIFTRKSGKYLSRGAIDDALVSKHSHVRFEHLRAAQIQAHHTEVSYSIDSIYEYSFQQDLHQ